MTHSNKDGKANENAHSGAKPRTSTGANTGANPGTTAGTNPAGANQGTMAGTGTGAHAGANPAANTGASPTAHAGANPAANAWAHPAAHAGANAAANAWANAAAAKTAYATPGMHSKESLTEEEQMKRYYELLTQIQESDFVLVELTLYLDTHPDDQAAIAQFNQFAQKSMILKQQFQALFGPLYQFGNSFSPTPFAWKEPPWPWQV